MIAQRIREVRNSIGKTQTSFGELLGVSRDVIANIENGRVEPTDLFIRSIIREFNVSEAWLRTGAGEMFEPRTRRDDIAAFMGQLLSGPDDFKTRFISVLANLDDSQWSLLADMAEQLAAEEENEKAGQE